MKIGYPFILTILILTLGTLFLWYKYKLSLVTNYITGGLILILLCKLNFLGFEHSWGKFGVFIVLFMLISYSMLHLSTLIIYFLDKKKNLYFVFPILTFVLISIFAIISKFPSTTFTFISGILVRIFLSFFPLLLYNYYEKHIKKIEKQKL